MFLPRLLSMILLLISLAMLVPIGSAVIAAFALWVITAGYFFVVTEVRQGTSAQVRRLALRAPPCRMRRRRDAGDAGHR